MNNMYAVSIDLGSQNIKLMLVKYLENSTEPKILAKHSYPSNGISYGYITNKKNAQNSIKNAINQFAKTTKIEITDISVSLDGYGLKAETLTINHTIPNGVIEDFDIEKIINKSKVIFKKKNNDEIIEQEITNYTIDNYEYFNDPIGLNAKKITANILFLTYPKNNIIILDEIFQNLNISAKYIPPIESNTSITISQIDRKIGALLIDYGAEKTNIILVEKDKIKNFAVIKKGSKNITEKISLLEKTSFEEAEKTKISKIKTSKINKIIKEELITLSEEIEKILHKWKKNTILPGGITIIGGGSRINQVEEILKNKLKLPIKKPKNTISDNVSDYYNNYIILTIEPNDNDDSFLPNLKILKNTTKFFKKILKNFSL